MRMTVRWGLTAVITAVLAGCGGGGQPSDAGTSAPPPSAPAVGCTGQCQDTPTRLTVADVQTVIAQAVAEAQANSLPATVAVVDRVGNVLAVYRMTDARATVTITSSRGITGGLENVDVPSELAAVSKAVTGAFLSSEGNAFSTRVASQIVQEHFNPGEFGGPSGPLFGVQFSQLLCSDLIVPPGPALTALGAGGNVGFGPKTSPLGLSADPGGFPLYKNGTVVGGIGIAADPLYSLDAVTADRDRNLDEFIAWAGTFGFSPPAARRGDRITADGKIFQFTNTEFEDLARSPAQAPAFSTLGPGSGGLIIVPGFFNGEILAGTAFGQPESGVRPDSRDYAGLDAFVLVDNNNVERYRPRAGTEAAGALTTLEVQTLLQEGLKIANRARAQIRSPFDSQARVTLSVVDSNGEVLGVVRTRDAPVFGTDVSLQKARTAAFFSSAAAATDLTDLGFANYVSDTRSFFGIADFLTGKFAITPRAIGNIARPFYPDGIRGTRHGPLSKPFDQWSPFTDGLQLDLVAEIVVGILGAYNAALPAPGTTAPTAEQVTNLLAGVVGVRELGCAQNPKLRNGIQIFPGASPVYRGNVLVGALGISGDGIDQDDMISFLGTANASTLLGGSIGHAPAAIRIDQTAPGGARLRYVQCPQAPFLNSNEQNVCEGL